VGEAAVSLKVGQRVAQHRGVVEAAQKNGVGHLVYTSAPKVDTSALILAPDHKATERASLRPGAVVGSGSRLWWWGVAALIDLIGIWLAHPLPGRALSSQDLKFDADRERTLWPWPSRPRRGGRAR
jgi:hypothetical protein